MPATAAEEADKLVRTQDYVKQHKINELFAHFLQLLVYHQPDDPRAFLNDEVGKIRQQKISSSLFTEKDLETMFDLIDVTKQRWITVQQLRNTCRNLATAAGENAEEENMVMKEMIANAADQQGRVGLDRFKEVLAMQLLTKNMWSE